MMFELEQEVSLLHEVGVFVVKSIEHHELVVQDEFGLTARFENIKVSVKVL